MGAGRLRLGMAAGLALAVMLAATGAQAQKQTPGGMTPAQVDELSQKHDGYFGALAPQNRAKRRPKPPFDLTGAWFVDLRKNFADFMFGPPYPEFYAAGQTAMKEAAAARKAGVSYRDSIGECYPAGMPMIMTRVWPIGMIQLPTAIYMVSSFENAYRVIYLDGRKFSDPDIVVPSYNGESIGHWDGKALVVHTKYIEPNQHFIDMGIPISDQFEITEKITLLDAGKTLQIDYVMTDPKSWKGEWRSSKRWMRADHSDIPEVECLPNLNQHLPSTEEGHAAVEEREKTPGKQP